MITNPYLPAPSAAHAWSEGFVKGLAGPQYSTEPPPTVAESDAQAFADGVLAGQQAAIDGLGLTNPCVPAGDEGSEAGHYNSLGEIVFAGVYEIGWKRKLLPGLAGLAVAFIELACSLPSRTLPPEQVLPNIGQTLVDTLAAFGLDSLEFFCGAGLDPTQADCEIKLSPLFVSLDQARQAAADMARGEWVVASWRTDQSRSFRIVETS